MCQDLHLTFWTDPGHGWLEVSQEVLDLVGLKPENFSQVRCTADDEEAYAYLKGEPLPAEAQKGWTLVCWQGHPLGFGKASQGMIKNHFPKGLRIYKK